MDKLLLIFSIVLFISCSSTKHTVKNDEQFNSKGGETVSNNAPDEMIDYTSKVTASDKELVREMCNCSWDIIRINRDTKRYHKNNDKNGLMSLKPKIAPAYAKFDKCMNELKARKTEKIASANANVMMAAMEKECPDLVEILEFTEPVKGETSNY